MKLFSMPAALSKGTVAVAAGVVTTAVIVVTVAFAVTQVAQSNSTSVSGLSTDSTAAQTTPANPGSTPEVHETTSGTSSQKSGTSPQLGETSSSGAPSPQAAAPAVETVTAPVFSQSNNYVSVMCHYLCYDFVGYTEPLPTATGTGPLSYSFSGLPAGVSFDPSSHVLVLDGMAFWGQNSDVSVDGTVWITGQVGYTASGPGGSTTTMLSISFLVHSDVG